MFKIRKYIYPLSRRVKNKNKVIPKGWFDSYLDYHRYDIVCHWKINKFCNYRCEYCYIDDYNGEENNKVNYKDYAEAFNKTNLTWHIRIDGGEPFFSNNFVELCHELTNRHFISLNTNLSHNKNILKFCERIDPKKVIQFKCSFHHGEIKKHNNFNQFIDNCKILLQRKFDIIVTIVCYPPYIQELTGIFEIFNENEIPVVGRVFNGRYGGKIYPKSYSKAQVNLFRRYLDPLDIYFLEKGSSFTTDSCLAGKRFLLFKNDGSLQRCGNVNERLGNIFEGEINLHKEIQPCPSPRCGCAYVGYLLTKQK